MKIKIIFDKYEIVFELKSNATSDALFKTLPMEVEIKDYASMEKIFYPPGKLSEKGAPDGYKPKAGDITYYAPWGNIAIFYQNFSYAKGLVYLGKILSGEEFLGMLDNKQVLIESTE